MWKKVIGAISLIFVTQFAALASTPENCIKAVITGISKGGEYLFVSGREFAFLGQDFYAPAEDWHANDSLLICPYPEPHGASLFNISNERLKQTMVLSERKQVTIAETNQTQSCESLPESECIKSSACKLEPVAEVRGKYQCRENRNICEDGFIQNQASKEFCENKTSCGFVPANCYCAPHNLCRCGGGSPASCVPSSSHMQ
jgi:hypothetical protein